MWRVSFRQRTLIQFGYVVNVISTFPHVNRFKSMPYEIGMNRLLAFPGLPRDLGDALFLRDQGLDPDHHGAGLVLARSGHSSPSLWWRRIPGNIDNV
jgi:hypothetical protein